MITGFRKGDHVVVNDPSYGDVAGRVSVVDEQGLVIDGPALDSRIIQYSITPDVVDAHVRPYPAPYHGRHRRKATS